MFARKRLWWAMLAGLALTPLVWSQCGAVKKQTFLVSDRFRDGARYQDHLLLANSHGLVIRHIDQEDANPLHIEPLSGDITRVAVVGDYVLATARGSGLQVLRYSEGRAFPQPVAFIPLEGLQSVQVRGSVLFAHRELGLTLHYFSPDRIASPADDPLPLLTELEEDITHFSVDDFNLFVRGSDARVAVYAYDTQGTLLFRNYVKIGSSSLFYGLHQAMDRIIFDGLEGINWATFSETGHILTSGLFYANRDGEIVLGSQSFEDYLYLRFADRIDVFRIGAARLEYVGGVPQEFQDVGHVTLVGTGDYLHLLNGAPQRREWSLASYHLGNTVQPLFRLDALFEELVAGADFGDQIYLAANRDIFLVDPENPTTFRDQQPLLTFDGNIQDMIASDALLYVTTPVPGTGTTRLYVFEEVEGGGLRQVHSRNFSGSLSSLSQYGDQLAFLRYVRTTSEDLYEINVLFQDDGGFQLSSLVEPVPLAGANPFEQMHLGDLGLVYLRNNLVWVYDTPTELTNPRNQQFPRPFTIEAVVALRGHYWIQTVTGLYLFGANGADSATQKAFYEHWRNLSRLPNNMILAQNLLRRNPGTYNLLTLEDDRLINDQVDFSTSDQPLFISFKGDDVMVGERASVNVYAFDCPLQEHLYLIPIRDELEMELSTVGDPTDVITMIIFNADGIPIGYQDLDNDLIGTLNGRRLPGWLFDYNLLDEPVSFVLRANRALAPVISGNVFGSDKARFAYRVPEQNGMEQYVPHVPKDLLWSTQLFVRNLFEAGGVVTVEDPLGNQMGASEFTEGSTDVISINGREGAPWVRVVNHDLNSLFAGFSLFRDTATQRAAAVPLISDFSSYLVLPYIAGRHEQNAWTGMVLANPHDSDTFVRILGYNGDGVIVRDILEKLERRSSLVLSVEAWLGNFDFTDDTRWLAVVAEDPIMGMAIYGNARDLRLSGLPLGGGTGHRLLLPGIRANEDWRTRIQITNQDPVGGGAQIIAYDGMGEVLEEVFLPLGPNQNVGVDVAGLFPILGEAGAEAIDTIRIISEQALAGFVSRSLKTRPTLESYRALAE